MTPFSSAIRLQEGQQFLDSDPEILFARYGVRAQDWTVVGTVGHHGERMGGSPPDPGAVRPGRSHARSHGRLHQRHAGLPGRPRPRGPSPAPELLRRPTGGLSISDTTEDGPLAGTRLPNAGSTRPRVNDVTLRRGRLWEATEATPSHHHPSTAETPSPTSALPGWTLMPTSFGNREAPSPIGRSGRRNGPNRVRRTRSASPA